MSKSFARSGLSELFFKANSMIWWVCATSIRHILYGIVNTFFFFSPSMRWLCHFHWKTTSRAADLGFYSLGHRLRARRRRAGNRFRILFRHRLRSTKKVTSGLQRSEGAFNPLSISRMHHFLPTSWPLRSPLPWKPHHNLLPVFPSCKRKEKLAF